jgi:hypothetical protein
VKLFILAAVALAPAFGQTQVDVGRQAKNVDFSAFPSVRPFPTGTALPATCVMGNMFFLTNATAGSNTYGCVATNSWALEGQGASVSGGTGLAIPLQVVWSTGTTLQIGPSCNLTAPCNVRLGAIVYSFVTPATVTLQSGSGLAYLYVDGTGALTAGTSSATTPQVSCTGCQTVNPISQFPVDAIPLAVWNATSGTWDPIGTDERTILTGGRTFSAGQNIQLTQSGDNVLIAAVTSSSQVSGSGGPIAAYNPLDMTQFNADIVFGDYGWIYQSPFGESPNCAGTGTRTGVAGEVSAPYWLGGNNNPCVLFYPGGGGGHPFTDFLSGATPLAYTLEVRFAAGGSAPGPANFYIGWSSDDDGTVNNFVGLRYLASSNVWQCLISSGGADLSANTMASAPDTSFHSFVVTNGTTANTVTCSIDGSAQTASGVIPPSTWYSVVGTSGNPTTYFNAIEERIQILGISR